jgi:hypothetical protein
MDMPKFLNKNREGMALAMAMFAIVVIGALIAGAFFASTQDFRIGRNSLVAQRAFSAAEYGLNKTMAEWDTKLNLGIKTGKDSSIAYAFADGGIAQVRITRINDYTYWVVSEGSAGAATPVETRRRTSTVLRLAYPAVKVGGAVTVAGGGQIKGSTQIYGTNVPPTGWDCASMPGRDTTGVAYAPGATLTIAKAGNVVGTPQSLADPNAANDGTYIKFGDESWTTLTQQADVIIPDGTNPGTLTPIGTATTCIRGVTNWGEPWRAPAAGTVLGCTNYFPIVWVQNGLHVNDGRGQGILLVEGDLRVDGRFEWDGLVIVRDDIIKGNGTPVITGAVMARNANLTDFSSEFLGNSTVQYSKCAIESALRGSARLVPAKQRAWAELW